jgi:hypothetical protein
MTKLKKNVKPVGELKPDDFRRHPIWSWYENDWDESLVMPVEIIHPLNEDEYLVFFILCDLILNDGTNMKGAVSINLNNKSAYSIEFFRGNEVFGFTGKWPTDLGNLVQLSNWLQKSVDEITPVKYITPYFFKDGNPIKGEIDLRDW